MLFPENCYASGYIVQFAESNPHLEEYFRNACTPDWMFSTLFWVIPRFGRGPGEIWSTKLGKSLSVATTVTRSMVSTSGFFHHMKNL
jgi:hypothetical protein